MVFTSQTENIKLSGFEQELLFLVRKLNFLLINDTKRQIFHLASQTPLKRRIIDGYLATVKNVKNALLTKQKLKITIEKRTFVVLVTHIKL